MLRYRIISVRDEAIEPDVHYNVHYARMMKVDELPRGGKFLQRLRHQASALSHAATKRGGHLHRLAGVAHSKLAYHLDQHGFKHLADKHRSQANRHHGYVWPMHAEAVGIRRRSEESMENTEFEFTLENLASLMDDADAMLERAGFEVDESVEDPIEYIEQLEEILDQEDLAEDIEEALCLNIALMDSILSEDEEVEETEEVDEDEENPEGEEQTEATMMARLRKARRRSLQKRGLLHTHPGVDILAMKEPGEMFRHYMDRRDKVLPFGHPERPAHPAAAHYHQAEEANPTWIDALNDLSDAVEEVGYEIPEDMSATEFVREAASLAESDEELDDDSREMIREYAAGLQQNKIAPLIAGAARVGTAALKTKLGRKAGMWAAKRVIKKKLGF